MIAFYVVCLGAAIYWFFYVGFIERIRRRHPSTYASLGLPTEMDSEFSVAYRRLWAFIFRFEFRHLGDRYLTLYGFSLLVSGLALLVFSVWFVYAQ
jgi:hypothetical protein